jgi:hypothetical protein
MAQHLHVNFDVDEPLFRWRQFVTPRQEVAGNRLSMSADEGTARLEPLAKKIVCAPGFGCPQGMRGGMQFLKHGPLGGSIGFAVSHL